MVVSGYLQTPNNYLEHLIDKKPEDYSQHTNKSYYTATSATVCVLCSLCSLCLSQDRALCRGLVCPHSTVVGQRSVIRAALALDALQLLHGCNVKRDAARFARRLCLETIGAACRLKVHEK
jgi:hypothetical protein